MSRSILALLLFILLGAGITLFFDQDNGYVLLRYGDIVVETSLVFFATGILLGLWLFILAWRALHVTVTLPRWLPAFYQRYRMRSARRSLLQGQLLLLEGRWAEAEKALAKRSLDEDTRVVGYLHAATAAQKLGATERRDYYLQQAAEDNEDGAATAVLLTQAELQLAAGQSSQALATLNLLCQKQPNHPTALGLLLQVSSDLHDWSRVRELWPEAQRHKILSEQALDDLATLAFTQGLEEAAEQGLEALDIAWQGLTRKLRHNPALQSCYVRLLVKNPAGHPEALRQITQTLKQHWRPELVLLFAELHGEDSVAQMSAVEGWLKQHGELPELQLVAGILCLRNKLWGRARSYLEGAIQVQPNARTWLALGQLKERTDDLQGAAQAYAQGLELLSKSSV